MKKNMSHALSTMSVCVAALLILSGCGGFQERSGTESVSQSEPVSQSEASRQAAPKPGALPGVDADNYPRVDGSTANMPLLAAVYSEICGVALEEAETMVTISGGTGAVWRNMLWEGADLLVVYEAPEDIKRELEGAGIQLEIDPLGRDGLVFLVNKANPVDSLTVDQLRAIYTGAVADWREIGGAPGPISAFQRNEESGSQTLFRKLLMDGRSPMSAPVELVPGSMGGLIEAVASYDGSGGAIGYSVYYYANLMYANPELKLLSVDGIAPSTETIGDGRYPLVNDFYVVIRADAPADSPERLLRDWLLTDEGAAVLTATNYVSVR